MAIRLKCGSCGKILKVSDEHAGRKVKCPECGERLQIPAAGIQRSNQQKRRVAQETPDTATVLFECPYGRLPGKLLYLGLPFLTAIGVGLFVASFWFGVEFSLRNLPIPPALVMYVFSPGLLLLVIGCVYVEFNQRKYPRRVVVRDDGVLVPMGRVKTGEMFLSRKGLKAKITSMGAMSEVNLKNAEGKTTRLNLMMFPTQDDFDGFLDALQEQADFE